MTYSLLKSLPLVEMICNVPDIQSTFQSEFQKYFVKATPSGLSTLGIKSVASQNIPPELHQD